VYRWARFAKKRLQSNTNNHTESYNGLIKRGLRRKSMRVDFVVNFLLKTCAELKMKYKLRVRGKGRESEAQICIREKHKDAEKMLKENTFQILSREEDEFYFVRDTSGSCSQHSLYVYNQICPLKCQVSSFACFCHFSFYFSLHGIYF